VDWDSFDPSALYAAVREHAAGPEADTMVRAFEQVFAAAGGDGAYLDQLAAATLCAIAYRDGTSPRLVAEQLFRRGPPDELWRERYAGLLGG
jgi:hypothetical protein